MTTRSPIFHRIPARFAAQVDYVVNLNLVLHFPNPTRPFIQTDWPRTTDLPKLKTVGEPIGRVNPVLTPNPTRPWSEYDWPRTTDVPQLKAVGEPIGRVNPLLTPNPSRPFSQTDWFSIRSAVKAKVDDFVNFPGYQIIVVVGNPFQQNLWDNAVRIAIKATGEATGGNAPLLTPNPVQPFIQSDWPQVPAARRAAILDTSSQSILILGMPFVQSDWLLAPAPLKAKVDDVINLVVGQVVVPAPFHQLWDLPARTPPKAAGEAVSGVATLLTPNPAQPFTQADWPSIRSTVKAKVDDFANLLPFQIIVPAFPPFQQNLWDSPVRSSPKASGEAVGGNAPVLTPNPPQPFNQSDWLRAPFAVKAKVDDVTNYLPFLPIIVPAPFNQADWPLPFRPRPASAGWDPQLALVFYPAPPVLIPFVQTDWQTPRYSSAGSRSGAIAGAPSVRGHHSKPMIVTMGKMLYIPGDPGDAS